MVQLMGTPHIGIVLAAVAPRKQHDVAELLREELAKKMPGGACIIPEISGNGTVQEIAQGILAALEQSGIITAADEPVYSQEEEEKIRRRLENLGYL